MEGEQKPQGKTTQEQKKKKMENTKLHLKRHRETVFTQVQ